MMKALPNTSFLPVPKSAPAGHTTAAAHLLWQVFPRYPCLEYKDNSGQSCPVRYTWTASFGRGLMFWQKWFNLTPQFVAYQLPGHLLHPHRYFTAYSSICQVLLGAPRTPNKTEKQSKRQQGIKKPNGYQLCVHIGRAGACIDGTRQRFAQQPSGAFQDERNCPPHVWQCGALYVSRCTPVCKTENRTLYQREVSEDDKWVSRANFAGRADDPAYIPAFCNHSHWRQ